MSNRTLVGHVDVDSGQIIIVDPCYVLPEAYNDKKGRYRKVCDATSKDRGTSEVNLDTTGGGMAHIVASSSGHGDGSYPVYAEYKDGCVSRLTIEFMEDTKEEE